MKALRKYIDKIKPNFEEGGKLHAFRSVFDGFETFLFVPNETSKTGVHIHDAIDSKRIMSFVVIALIPALLFGMFNVGYQNFMASGTEGTWLDMFIYGFLAVLPKIVVAYAVGLGIEFVVAQWKNEEIQEGFLVSGMLIPLIIPVNTPLWILAIAVAFSVIFAKEIFGGTGMNIFNPAVLARAFVFFAYTPQMSGEKVWYPTNSGMWSQVGEWFGATDATTGATALEQLASNGAMQWSALDAFLGFIPGSFGETSTVAILIGAVILLVSGVASWKTMVSVFVGGLAMAYTFNLCGAGALGAHEGFEPYMHLIVGGFAFGAVFMATDPVTSAQTSAGKYIVGFMTGALAILIREFNPAYPEGMMLSILFMNALTPLVDYFVVEANIRRRKNRVKTVK